MKKWDNSKKVSNEIFLMHPSNTHSTCCAYDRDKERLCHKSFGINAFSFALKKRSTHPHHLLRVEGSITKGNFKHLAHSWDIAVHYPFHFAFCCDKYILKTFIYKVDKSLTHDKRHKLNTRTHRYNSKWKIPDNYCIWKCNFPHTI